MKNIMITKIHAGIEKWALRAPQLVYLQTDLVLAVSNECNKFRNTEVKEAQT